MVTVSFWIGWIGFVVSAALLALSHEKTPQSSEQEMKEVWFAFANRINKWARNNGFWDFSVIPNATLYDCYHLARCHYALSQQLEALRKGKSLNDARTAYNWPDASRLSRKTLERIAKTVLIHSETSELLVAYVTGDRDDHLPKYLGTEAEIADIIIRALDLGHEDRGRIGAALLDKQTYNEGRPYRNGKGF